ncbi:MAG TPA: hypothetical protein VJ485_00465 [archaeon]|nr:hypothetical protein [archaeon]
MAKQKQTKTKLKERYVTVCPKCGSDDVQGETNPAYAASGLFNQFKQCNNCGHHGEFFPEVPKSKVAKIPKRPGEVKNKQLVEPSLGKGYYNWFKYIVIPLAIIFLIIYVFLSFI